MSAVYYVVTWVLHSILAIPLFFLYPYFALLFFIGDDDKSKREALQTGLHSDSIQDQILWYTRYISLSSVAIMKDFDINEVQKSPMLEDPKTIAWEFLLQWFMLGGEFTVFMVLILATIQQGTFNIDFSRIIRFG